VNSPIELLSVCAIGQLATLEELVTQAVYQLYAGAAELSVALLDPNILELRVPSGYARMPIERVSA
jgi:hypothetical protein